MQTLGNILWHIPFCGFVTAIAVFLIGLLLTLTIVAAPVGLGLMQLSKLLLWPFGNAMVSKDELDVDQNEAWRLYSGIIWLLYFPIGLLLAALLLIQIVCLSITIVGLPAALVVAKSLGTFFNPVNKICVPEAVVDELERRKSRADVERYLRSE